MPLHAQLRRGLRCIIDEHCIDGQKFFTEPQLIEHLNISQSTVRRSLLDLAREGLLFRRVAKGSFVQKNSRNAKAAFTVHAIVPEWNADFFMRLLEALASECGKAEWNIRVHHTRGGDNTADIYREINGPPGEEGVLLIGNEPRATLSLEECLSERNHRVVNIDTLIANYPGQFVGTSNEAVVKIGLDHLQALGHRAITFLISEPEEHGSVLQRAAFFEAEAAARGLPEARVFHCGTHFYEDSFETALHKMPEVMASSPRPTALLAMSDPGAWAALKWAAEQNISIPGELSVLGFSDDRPSRFTHPSLTTIAHPINAIAQKALLLLKGDLSAQTILLTPELIVRESTGPAAC